MLAAAFGIAPARQQATTKRSPVSRLRQASANTPHSFRADPRRTYHAAPIASAVKHKSTVSRSSEIRAAGVSTNGIASDALRAHEAR